MRKIIFPVLFLVSMSFYAQTALKGIVMDDTNYPIPGATIIIKGTSIGVTSDFDGNFSIDIPSANSTIVISYLGYESEEVIITNQDTITVILSEGSQQLEEVIIIGYGSSTKSDVTAAITTVNLDNDKKAGVVSVESILKGTSGINVLSNGEPGAAVSINIRGTSSLSGSNQPLYVIDGIVMDSSQEFLTDPTNFQSTSKSGIGGVAPEDIASMQVLKDASATAIYGSLGANGVILITTKTGKVGAPKFRFSTSTTIGEAETPYNMLNTEEYVTLLNNKYKADPNSFAAPEYLYPEGVNPLQIRPDGLYNFISRNDDNGDGDLDLIGIYESKDWANYYRTTVSTNTRLNVSGGSEKTNYYASVGYLSNEGIISNVYLNKLDLNINLRHKINDKLDVGAKFSFTNSKNSLTGGSSSNAGEENAVYRHLNDAFPIELREDLAPLGKESFRLSPRGWFDDYDNISKENRYLGNVSLKYRISRSLTYDLKIGGDLRIANLHIWQGIGTKSGSAREGRYAFSELDRFTYNIDQTVLFRPKKIGQHRYSLLAGVVYANTDSEKRFTRASNYTTEGQLNRGRDFFGR